MIGFLVGLFMGASLGVMVMAILVASSDRDAELDEYDAYLRRIQHIPHFGSDRLYPAPPGAQKHAGGLAHGAHGTTRNPTWQS